MQILKCLQCSSEEHLRRDCPLLKVICKKCKQKGHAEDKCTMANRLKPVGVDEGQDLNRDDLDGEVQQQAATPGAAGLNAQDAEMEVVKPAEEAKKEEAKKEKMNKKEAKKEMPKIVVGSKTKELVTENPLEPVNSAS